MDNNKIKIRLEESVNEYIRMDLGKLVVRCPYWMNKLVNGKVTIRGFANGKGTAAEIRSKLIRLINSSGQEITPESFHKFSKRYRVGIDCSGFVYRMLNAMIKLPFWKVGFQSLDEIFTLGINKTNACLLTDNRSCVKINDFNIIQPGDLIRMKAGHHIAIIMDTNGPMITYAHSSNLTEISGVHTGTIRINKPSMDISGQDWSEKIKSGSQSFSTACYPGRGDGIFRLKIFS